MRPPEIPDRPGRTRCVLLALYTFFVFFAFFFPIIFIKVYFKSIYYRKNC